MLRVCTTMPRLGDCSYRKRRQNYQTAQRISSSCISSMELSIRTNCQGLTTISSQLGLSEIQMASATRDGEIEPVLDASRITLAKDGLVDLGGLHLDKVHSSGITTVISPCLSSGFFEGVSVAFRSSAKNGMLRDSYCQMTNRLLAMETRAITQGKVGSPRANDGCR